MKKMKKWILWAGALLCTCAIGTTVTAVSLPVYAEETAQVVETMAVEYKMGASELEVTSRWRTDTWVQSGAAAAVNATVVNNTDYATVTASSNDAQLWYYNNYAKIKGLTSIEITYRAASTVTATKLRVRSFKGGSASSYGEITLTKNGDWQTATMTLADLTDESVTQIRVDPLAGGAAGDVIDIKSITFQGSVELEELSVTGRFNENATHDYIFGQYNGVDTNGYNNQLNGWTHVVTQASDLVITKGWIIVKSDNGLVGISKYQYKINDGAWTDVAENGITERNMWFSENATHGYILNGQYNQATAGIEGLTVPTSSLESGEYNISLRALTTNYKTITWNYTYRYHNASKTDAVEATCNAVGNIEYWTCSTCGKLYSDAACTLEISQADTVVAIGEHTLTKTDAVAATCTEAGNVEYWTCSGACQGVYADEACTTAITEEQIVISATGHTEETVAAVAATCTESGLTEGKKCSVCDTTVVAQETVAATGHTEETVAAVAATCTESGLTEGKKCSVCDTAVVAQETVAATGHTEETVAAVAATCTESGLTEGKKCSVCDTTVVAQETVAATGHTEGDWIVDIEAQVGVAGSKHKDCTVCGEEVKVEEIPALEDIASSDTEEDNTASEEDNTTSEEDTTSETAPTSSDNASSSASGCTSTMIGAPILAMGLLAVATLLKKKKDE